MYRSPASAPFWAHLEAVVAPRGMRSIVDASLSEFGVERVFHRKTWDSNRAIVLANARSADVIAEAFQLRPLVSRRLGSSFWNQLFLHFVLATDGSPRLGPYPEDLGHQVAIVSVYGLDTHTREAWAVRAPAAAPGEVDGLIEAAVAAWRAEEG